MNIDKAKEFLADWVTSYLKNRDLMAKSIESIEKGKDGFDVYVKFKDKEQFIFTIPTIGDLTDALSKMQNKEANYVIVTLNNKSSLKGLINNWDKLVQYRFLSVFFINPSSSTDKRWIIYPYTHDKICEKSALSKGLNAMFEMVEPISEEDIK